MGIKRKKEKKEWKIALRGNKEGRGKSEIGEKINGGRKGEMFWEKEKRG